MRLLRFVAVLATMLICFHGNAAEVKYSKNLAGVFDDYSGVMAIKELNADCILVSDKIRAAKLLK